MEIAVPASWLQDAIIDSFVKSVVDQVTAESEGNTVSTVLSKPRDDGSLSVIWSWKPAGANRLSDVRRGEVRFTAEEAALAYAASLKPVRKRKQS
jgi:hypothetical protein